MVIRHVGFVFLSTVFFLGASFSLFRIGLYLSDGIKTGRINASIEKIMFSAGMFNEKIGSLEEGLEIKEEGLEIKEEGLEIKSEVIRLEEFSKMYKKISLINEDYVGYINIRETNIQYPILQGKDNTFYLDHNIEGKKSSRGSIFMDYRNSADFSDDNTLVYGHNMKDGSMFHNLLKYKEEGFNETIWIATETEMLEYRVFAAYKTERDADYLRINFQDEEDFNLYIETISETISGNTEKAANISSGSAVIEDEIAGAIKYGDRMLTLSTCEIVGNKYRYVVHGVLRR